MRSWTSSGTTHAFLYSNGQSIEIGGLPGFEYSAAYGINDLGQIVGSSWNGAVASHERVWVYSEGVLQDLGIMGGNDARPAAINNLGQLIGTGTNITGFGGHSWVWSAGVVTVLGDPLFGDSYLVGIPEDINDLGQIVG